MRKGYQHGEILLKPVNTARGDKTEVNSCIVGHSETGHHHVLESAAKFEVITDQEKQELYVRLFEPAKLVHRKTHDKHRTLNVKPGTYKVLHKTEYDPFEGVIRDVQD